MKRLIFSSVLTLVFLTSCEEKSEIVEITETRRLTTKDKLPKLNATSDQRFRDVKPAPFTAPVPEGWLQVPPTKFRTINFKFGESGLGEAYLSIAGGGLLDNVNRWMRQFGKDPLIERDLQKLKQSVLLSSPALIVEAKGRFTGGMGKLPQEGFALLGVIGQYGNQLITVKMMGPEAEVAAEREKLLNWTRDLQPKN